MLGFVLSAMVGHLFGYEAALAIDASAHPLRAARETIEELVGDQLSGDDVLERLNRDLVPMAGRFHDGVRTGVYDGHLEASSAVQLSRMFGHVLSDRPVHAYQQVSGKVATPSTLIDDLVVALTEAIDELTRPVDTIKHQAKTVTVGISRSDEGIIDRPLVQAVLDAGAGRDVLSYRTLKILADLDPAVADVRGLHPIRHRPRARHRHDHRPWWRSPATCRSRVEGVAALRGTKHRVASERDVLVGRGRSDGRTLIFVPEVKGGETTGLTLLHVKFHDTRPAEVMRGVLQGYDRRYDRLVDTVTETEGTFDESLLGDIPVEQLLIGPVIETAELWRR